MSAFKPPRSTRQSHTETVSGPRVSPQTNLPRRTSFGGASVRVSNSGRESPYSGYIPVNRIVNDINKQISESPIGQRTMILANGQARLEGVIAHIDEQLSDAKNKLKGLTNENEIKKTKGLIDRLVKELQKTKSAVNTVTSRPKISAPKRRISGGSPPLKRTKSTEDMPVNFISQLKRVTGQINRSKETVIETQAPTKFTTQPPPTARKPKAQKVGAAKKEEQPSVVRQLKFEKGNVQKNDTQTVNNSPRTPTNKPIPRQPAQKAGTANLNNTAKKGSQPSGTRGSTSNKDQTPEAQGSQPSVARKLNFEKGNVQNNDTQTENNSQRTPKKPIPTQSNTPNQKNTHRRAKKEGSKKRANERRERWAREGSPLVKINLGPIFNQIAKQKNSPPGITKTNLERLLQPFKQPVTVTVAPTISVKGGSAKQGIVMLKSNTMQKKKTPPPKPQYLKSPATLRREKEKARSIAMRKQLVASIRTPTKGQRKIHVIQLIGRALRKIKAPKDVEKKLIKVYESLSEKQIKSLFGGRSPEFVKKTLKKQVEYLKKKR